MENTPAENTLAQDTNKTNDVSLKFKKPKPLTIAIGVAVILIIVALFFAKGIFVAATVNGSPISRFAVINELERQAGQQAIDALITKKLIANEARARNIVVDESELNGEIQTIESQMAAMGATLEDQLQQQGITEKDMRNQLIEHLTLEKLLGEQATVSEEEITAYITENKVTIPKDEEAGARKKIQEQIREGKVDQLAVPFLAELKTKAKIKYYVNY